VESGGFLGSDRPVPAEAATVATELGIDLSSHRSRPLMPDVVASADLIIVMDAAQHRAICAVFGRHPNDVIVLGDLDPEPIETRAIHDPVLQPVEIFKTVYQRIDRCVRALASVLKVAAAS
jgi:protein-tyrosine phosphatase